MKKKFTFILSFVLIACLLLTTGIMLAFADGEDEKEELVLPNLYYGDEVLYTNNCLYFDFSASEGYAHENTWISYALSNFSYVEKESGSNKIKEVKSWPNYLLIALEGKPQSGDIFTIKAGFEFCGKVLKEDATYTFIDDNATYIKGSIETLKLGSAKLYETNWLEIALTDSAQSISGGFVGDSVQFGIFDKPWNCNYINDVKYISLTYKDKTYYPSYVRNLGNTPSTTAIRIQFEDSDQQAVTLTSLGKGAFVRFAPECLITAGPAYDFGENGLNYYYDGSNWSQVEIATEAETSLNNTQAELSDMHMGTTIQLDYEFQSDYGAPAPTFTSSDVNVITVNDEGLVNAVSEGTATVTIDFGDFQLTAEITVTPALTAQALSVEITEQVFNDDGALVAYVGEELDKSMLVEILSAKVIFDNGSYGPVFELTEEDISFDGYDNSKEGTSAITIIRDGLSGTLPVHLYKINTFTGPTAGNVSFWGTVPHLNITSLTTNNDFVNVTVDKASIKVLGLDSYVSLRAAQKNGATEYSLECIYYLYQAQIVLTFTNKGEGNMQKGDVLTLKKGFRIYKRLHDDKDNYYGAYIAVFELADDIEFVWDGSYWKTFTADAEEIELQEESVTLSVGASYVIPYTVKPSGSYISAKITSSDTSTIEVSKDGTAITVLKASDTPVTVTIMLGNDESTKKILTVTAKEFSVVGFEIYGDREINIARGTEFSFNYYYGSDTKARNLQAVAVYENGSRGVPFDIDESNTEISGLDIDTVGIQNINLTISHEGYTFTAVAPVKVCNVAPLVSNFVGDDIFSAKVTQLYIGFSQSITNEVNIPTAITGDKIASYIKFIRGENEYEVSAWLNGTYLVVEPIFPSDMADADKVFKAGDKIVLGEGMPLYRWTGQAQNYNMIGEGEYIVAGTIEYMAVYETEGNKNWNTYIDYVDFTVANETIELGYGKLGDVGATMVPSYATIGEFSVVSSNPDIVSVNANGLIKGEKIGTAELTITLSHERLDPIVKKITVTVVDVKSGIKFSEDKIYVPTGTVTITGQTLKDLGLTGVYVWASGKEEGEVDFSNVKIQGFSANAEGEQEITIRITENGVTVAAKLTVVIGEKPKSSGCGSAIYSNDNAAALLLVVSVMLISSCTLFMRRKTEKSDK